MALPDTLRLAVLIDADYASSSVVMERLEDVSFAASVFEIGSSKKAG